MICHAVSKSETLEQKKGCIFDYIGAYVTQSPVPIYMNAYIRRYAFILYYIRFITHT